MAAIIMSSYDLCAALYEHVNRFPRAQRTLLGRLILDEALRMLAALTLANRLADKRESLAEASGHLDALRIAPRLAKRLAYLPNCAYARLAETLDEVGVLCQRRGVCPSCAAKRGVMFGALLAEEVLEDVGHQFMPSLHATDGPARESGCRCRSWAHGRPSGSSNIA